METNNIPEIGWKSLNNLEEYTPPHSFTEEGKKGVQALCSFAPDFPEVWICDSNKSDIKRVDNDLLMDFGVVKVFWVENQKAPHIKGY